MKTARACPSTKRAEKPNKTAQAVNKQAVNNLFTTCRQLSTTLPLRLSNELLDRARSCADAVDEPLTRWLSITLIPGKADKHAAANRQAGVTVPRNLIDVTRTASTVVRVSLRDQSPADTTAIRQAIAEAVISCERRNPTYRNTLMPHVQLPRIGLDYLLETIE